jgi:hypothetical protein
MRMHYVSGCALALVCVWTAYTQTDSAKKDENAWKVDIISNLLIGWNHYDDNWTGDELSSFSWIAKCDAIFERQFTKLVNNRNTLRLAYGQTRLQQKDSTGDRKWLDFEKSTDLVDFESLLRFTPKTVIEPFVSIRFISQFYDARDTNQARAFNPFELTESFGGSRSLVKTGLVEWDARLGGAVRQSVDRMRAREDWVTNDGGVELVTGLKAHNKAAWWSFASALKIYEALFSSIAEQDTENNWRYPDINWENSLVINLTKYIMLNWYMQLLYDKEVDVDPAHPGLDSGARIKNTLSAGFTVSYKK